VQKERAEQDEPAVQGLAAVVEVMKRDMKENEKRSLAATAALQAQLAPLRSTAVSSPAAPPSTAAAPATSVSSATKPLAASTGGNVTDTSKCIICFEREREVLFYPCGHISCCQTCGKAQQQCPVCRAAVKDVVKTFTA